MVPLPIIAPVIIAPVDHCWFSRALEALTTYEVWLFVDGIALGVATIELGVLECDGVLAWSAKCAPSTTVAVWSRASVAASKLSAAFTRFSAPGCVISVGFMNFHTAITSPTPRQLGQGGTSPVGAGVAVQ